MDNRNLNEQVSSWWVCIGYVYVCTRGYNSALTSDEERAVGSGHGNLQQAGL